MRKIDLTGQTFGKLTAITKTIGNNGRPRYTCSCECGKVKDVSARNLQRKATTHCGCSKKSRNLKMPPETSLLNGLVWTYKGNAKKRKLEFSLSNEQCNILFKSNCYYCDDKPNKIFKKYRLKGEFVYNGIDRLDNNLGYTVKNSVSCCKMCNYMKSAHSYDNFINKINKITANCVKYAQSINKDIIIINPKEL